MSEHNIIIYNTAEKSDRLLFLFLHVKKL